MRQGQQDNVNAGPATLGISRFESVFGGWESKFISVSRSIDQYSKLDLAGTMDNAMPKTCW
jgi:hypothetical protein